MDRTIWNISKFHYLFIDAICVFVYVCICVTNKELYIFLIFEYRRNYAESREMILDF